MSDEQAVPMSDAASVSAETTPSEEIELLLHYLQAAREALLWKLEGLSEYDLRRPMTPTGTNLLGLVKHVASIEHGYLTECLGRESAFAAPWLDDDAPDNADMWATPEQSREFIVGLYKTAWASDDAAVRELGPDATGTVPWWGERGVGVSVRRLLIHVIAETNRHAGHADIVRELIDGTVGMRVSAPNLPGGDAAWWSDYVAVLEAAARTAHAD